MTPAGIEPATLRFVAQRLSHCAAALAYNTKQIFPMTPAGIEPATFRFVAQRLSHCAAALAYNTKQILDACTRAE